MTFVELIKQYHNRILAVTDKKVETDKIIQEISRLKYTSNNKTISNEDKKKILAGLKKELLNESFLIHSKDNKEHLELIDQAIKMLGGK